MKALQLIEHGSPGTLELREVPAPRPGPDEVVVRVAACGLNHLDLWLEEAALPMPVQLPRTPGGEVAGIIARCGTNSRDWTVGESVAVQSNLFCGDCEYCVRGDESLCLRGRLLGVHLDGGFAEEVLVPEAALVRMPKGLSALDSAALTLAGSTAMHMLTRRTQVRPGDWVLVMGAASGVGSAAIQIARELGGRVIATASSHAKGVLATALGAEAVIDPALADWPAQVRKVTSKHGVDIVVEHIGGNTFEKLFDCLARGGTIVTCGATSGREVQVNLWPFFVKEQRIIGSYGRNRADIVVTLEWAAQGRLKPVIDRVIPFSRGAEAFAALRERTVLGKIVLVPDGN